MPKGYDENRFKENESDSSCYVDGEGITHKLVILGTTPEFEERYRDMMRLSELEKRLKYAIKKENCEAAKILQERRDSILEKYKDESDVLDDFEELKFAK